MGDGKEEKNQPDGSVRRAHVEGGLIHAADDSVQVITDHFEWKE